MRNLAIALAAALAGLQLLRGPFDLPSGPAASEQGAQPDRERAWRANNLGVALLEQFDYEGAARSFREALQLAPDLPPARLNLAIALFYGGHTEDAAVEARAAAARMPDTPSAHFVLGLAEKAQDHVDEATAAFGRVLQLDPADAATKVHLGQIHLQQRRYQDALQLFQAARSAEPYNVTAAYNAALALTRAGRSEEGRQAMQRFEALRDSAYGVTYAQAYLAQGRYGEATTSTGAEPDMVNPAPPVVTFTRATAEFLPASVRPAAPASTGTAGGATLFDVDDDGDLDLFEIGRTGARFLRNSGRRFTDDTARAGLSGLREGPGLGAIAGDYDNDGKPDLFLLRDDGPRLIHQKADGTFEDVSRAAGLPASPTAASAAAFADVDHDGDLDIVAAGAATQLLRNNGNATFADITAAAGLGPEGPPRRGYAIVAADFDNRRDIDILIAGNGLTPALFRNMRDGSFRDAAAELGVPAGTDYAAVTAADVNKDGYTDLFLGKRTDAGMFVLSDGQGKFRTAPAPAASRAESAAQFVDYDNDGLLDLLTLSPQSIQLFRNIGGGRWTDASDASGLVKVAPGAAESFQGMALGDLDTDGDMDIVIRGATGDLNVWRNDGGNRNASLRVRLAARVSNRSGIGSKIELRAGSLRQILETSAASPPVGPADVLFGLGPRTTADAVRVLWPSGILQAETSFPGPAPAAGRAHTLKVEELDRKPSSCPYLFTWNGTRFEFVTDFMGGGEMGGWAGPAAWNQPDPDEYVRLPGDKLQPRDGRYELRITNELEEALFVDHLQLVAVDHPAGVEVFPNEGLKQPPRPSFKLTAARSARPPVRAADEHGHDVLARIASQDRLYPDDFDLLPIRGYAAPHELILDLGPVSDRAVLLMTGWTDYAFSSDNVAASQRGTGMTPPSLQVKDATGAWRTVIDEIGFPVGRPQTVVVNLDGKFLSAAREVRILTNMRIYWDQILVTASDGAVRPRMTRLDPVMADLRWRGVSAEDSPDGREPFGYDYQRVSTAVPWKVMAGRYTREGDVRPLLRATDDMFVVSRPGDEIALSFDAQSVPELAAGWRRTFLLYAYGYSKEMNLRSASPDTVAPLPFRKMTRYPYAADEHYPRTKVHRDYLDRYNTRIVSRAIPPMVSPDPRGGTR
jgi:tetratricopeptide (TPR) repeat protein